MGRRYFRQLHCRMLGRRACVLRWLRRLLRRLLRWLWGLLWRVLQQHGKLLQLRFTCRKSRVERAAERLGCEARSIAKQSHGMHCCASNDEGRTDGSDKSGTSLQAGTPDDFNPSSQPPLEFDTAFDLTQCASRDSGQVEVEALP
jgi:hypothetical protein